MAAAAFSDQRALCLWLLREAKADGITPSRLHLEGVGNPTMRLSELRTRGHIIRGRRVEGQHEQKYTWVRRMTPGELVAEHGRRETNLADLAAMAKPPALLAELDGAHVQLRFFDGKLYAFNKARTRATFVCQGNVVGKELPQLVGSTFTTATHHDTQQPLFTLEEVQTQQ